MFLPIRVNQARAVLAQGIQSLFPRAEHGDVTSRLHEPRGKERRKRACADDKNFCVHRYLRVVQVLVSVVDFL